MKAGSSFRPYPSNNAVATPTLPVRLECGTPSISVNIEGVMRRLILDTGSNISILQPGMSRCDVSVTTMKPYGVTGQALDVRGQQSVVFEFDGREFRHTFLVCTLPTDAAGLLGTDFMEGTGAVINFECSKMSLTGIAAAPRTSVESPSEPAALTVFTQGKEGRSPQPSQEKRQEAQRPSVVSSSEVGISQSRTWLVKARETITIAPRCRQVVMGRLETEKGQDPPLLVCIEPVQIPIEGIFPARALSRVEHSAGQSVVMTSRHGCEVTGSPNSAYVMIANFSGEELTLPKSTVIGLAEEVSEPLIDKINAKSEPSANAPTKPPRKRNNKLLYDKLLHGKLDHLTQDDRRHIEPVLLKYAHIFHDEESNDFKETKVVEHQIIVGDTAPIRRPPYRTPYALRQEMQDQVQKMLDKGIIRESNSPWSAPAILVPKKSLDGKPKYRFCVDFRALNAVTKFDPYPLPIFEEATSALHGSKYFSVLDCYSGFWQVGIKEEHKELTGFSVPSGHYEFNRLPFGLSNSPANFQRLMDTVLKDLIGLECFCFVDDLVIFSSTAAEHARRLESVLQRFEEANLQLHPGKCVFAQPQVQYLGFVLSENGVSASPEKVKAVRQYPTPKNVRDVRAFLGLASFYRRLVPQFAELAKPLTMLTRKNREFSWGPSQQEAFDRLKEKLCTPPVLAYPNFKLPFILTTDASKIAVAAVLSQVQDGVERPLAFASRQMNSAEQAYSASEAEMLAVVWATKYFRCYLFGNTFVLRTDHSALTYLRKFSDQNSRLLRWSLKLSELDFTIEHRPGSKIAHADALSRHVGTVKHGSNLDRENVLREQAKDAFCARQKPGAYHSKSEFFLDDDAILYKRNSKGNHQLIVPATLIHDVIRQNHDPPYAAHAGVKRTHSLISLRYWWPGMRKDIENYVKCCDLCQRRKENREFTAPLGKPETPTSPFEVTAMDITGPYPLTPRGNRFLLTFVDHLTKYVEAYPIPDVTAETCARVYASQIVTRHGTGSQLITDQGRNFMSSFFQETCKLLGIRTTRTSTYHPMSNGVLERWHRSLHDGLSHYINSANTNWDTLVPFFLMAYRATPNTVTGYSPFFLLHGREMETPSNDNLKARVATGNLDHDRRLENLRKSLKSAYKLAARANQKSQQINKRLYDRKAKERNFNVGDLVYLYSPARKPGLSKKFYRPWTGPYKITRKTSELNYEIVSQTNKKQVVHENRLKKIHGMRSWKPNIGQQATKKPQRRRAKRLSESDENEEEFKFGSFPLAVTEPPAQADERVTPPGRAAASPDPTQLVGDTPSPRYNDPSYHPPETPRSRREMQTTRTDPPLTRSRARIMSQSSVEP